MTANWPAKDPDEVLDYGFDWSPRDLGNDTIASTTADVLSGGVIIDAHAVGDLPDVNTGFGTKTRISSGTPGLIAQILLSVTTGSGQVYEETVNLRIRER